MNLAPVTLFPKRCHLHKLPMVWKMALSDLSSGWECPKCLGKFTCRVHGDPMRSGFGGLYCRRCRISAIKTAASPKREAIALNPAMWTGDGPGRASGVALIWRKGALP